MLAVTLLKMFGGHKKVHSPYYLKVGNLKKKEFEEGDEQKLMHINYHHLKY